MLGRDRSLEARHRPPRLTTCCFSKWLLDRYHRSCFHPTCGSAHYDPFVIPPSVGVPRRRQPPRTHVEAEKRCRAAKIGPHPKAPSKVVCRPSNWIQLVLCSARGRRRGPIAYSHVVCWMEDLQAADSEKVYWAALYRTPNAIGRRHPMTLNHKSFEPWRGADAGCCRPPS